MSKHRSLCEVVFCSLVLALVSCSSPRIDTIVGTGEAGTVDGSIREAKVNNPFGLIRGLDGALWFCEYDGHSVQRIDPNGEVTTVVGQGEAGYEGDGGPALQAKLYRPHEIRFDEKGDLFIADTESHSIRMIDIKTGIIDLIAGTGAAFDGQDGDPLECGLARPHGVFVEQDGSVLIGDSENHKIRVWRP